MSDQHKNVAEGMIAIVADYGAMRPPPEDGSMAVAVQVATAHALLALVENVAELVEQQRIANTIAAFQSGVVAPSEYDRAAAAARQLLSLPKEQPFI